MTAKNTLPLSLVEEKQAILVRNRRRHGHLLMLILAAFTTYTVYVSGLFSSYTKVLFPSRTEAIPTTEFSHVSDADSNAASTKPGGLVPLEAHVISKCPDTRDCLRELLLPAMIRVYDKVDFTLTYIGVTTENDGVECKHGPGECMGNIIELCAHHLYPDPKIWLGFTMCLTKDYHLIPQRELVEDCALEHAVDFEKINECATRDDGAFGMAMLRDSVERSASVRTRIRETPA
ncbi:hypothetical protein GGS20DRAFT_85466 [Poronia punctata]|nr:hypothetical protein GGS20DRAFT_85466 [Poronia punctata]